MASMSGSNSESSQKSKVWAGQSPFLSNLYNEAQNLYQGFTPNTEIPAQAQAAYSGFLNPQGNPYLQQMTQQYSDQLGQLNQRTAGDAVASGGYGGGRQGVANYLNTQNVGNQLGQFMGQQYQADQNRAFSALGQTGQVMGLDPQNQQQDALNRYAQMIGAPTVLGSGSSSAKGGSFGIG